MDASLSFSNRLYFAISILFLVRSTISNDERFGKMDLFEVDSYQHEVEIIPQPVKEIDIKNIIQDDDHVCISTDIQCILILQYTMHVYLYAKNIITVYI